MNDRRTTILVLAPLFALASLAAHALAYLVAEPDGTARASVLARTGHTYLIVVPALAGSAALVLVVALALRILAAAAGASTRPVQRAAAVVPVVGFVVQEILERAISGGASASLLTERPFLLGLALELVFGAVAVRVAWILLRGADTVGRLVARVAPPRVPTRTAFPRPILEDVPSPRYLPYLAAGRAPPAAAS